MGTLIVGHQPARPGIGTVVEQQPVEVLVRRVRVVRGRLPFRLECRPAFNYARARHETHVGDHGARFDGPELSLGLAASVPLTRDGDAVASEFTLGEGESATFVLRTIDRDTQDAQPGQCPGTGEAEDRFRGTVAYWPGLGVPLHLSWALA